MANNTCDRIVKAVNLQQPLNLNLDAYYQKGIEMVLQVDKKNKGPFVTC
jgi:hypothetical protein